MDSRWNILILKGQSRLPGAKFLDKKLKCVESLVVDRIFEPRDHPSFERSARYIRWKLEPLFCTIFTLPNQFYASFSSSFPSSRFWGSQVIVVKNTMPIVSWNFIYFIRSLISIQSFSMRFFIEYSTFIAVSFL